MNQSTSSDISFFKSFYVRYICVLLKTFHHFYQIVSYQAVHQLSMGFTEREAQNEVFLKFHHALEISHHANNASLLLPTIKYWKNKSFHDFIVKTNKLIEIDFVEIPESMIECGRLKIYEINSDCVQFLNIFKETNGLGMNTQNITSADIKLFSYNDYKNILNLLEYLGIENIVGFFNWNTINEISNDLVKLCQMVTGKDIVADVIFKDNRLYPINNLEYTIRIFLDYDSVHGIKILKELINNVQILRILFIENCIDPNFITEIRKLIEFAIINKKQIQLGAMNKEIDQIDGFGIFNTYLSQIVQKECQIDEDSEYITFL